MKDELLYRKIEANELEEVNDFNGVGIDAWMREFYSPLMEPSILFGCYNHNGELIGTEGYIGYTLNYNDSEIISHRSERTLVSNNYRGKGIFNTLIRCCDEFAIQNQSCLVWGATSALKPFSSAGFAPYVGFRTYIFLPVQNPFIAIPKAFSKANFTCNPLKLYRAYKSSDLRTLIEFVAFISSVVSMFKYSSKRHLYNVEVKEDFYDAEEISSLKKTVFSNTNMYSINIDEHLLDWIKHLGNQYRYYSFYYQEQLIGYLITREDDGSSVIRVVDFCFSDVKWVEPVFRKLSDIIKNTKYSNLLIVLNVRNSLQKEYSNILLRMGGYSHGKAGSFVIKNFKNEFHAFNDIGQMYLTDIWLAS